MSAIFLRRLLIATVATVALPAVAKNMPPVNFIGCDPTMTLFFSYTKDQHRAVELCHVKGDYRYTYGKFTVEGQYLKPATEGAVQATLKPGEAGSIHRDDIAGFAIKQGDTFTWLESETNGDVNLVTAKGGWDGWQTAIDRKAIALDAAGWGYANQIEQNDVTPFTYDYTNVDYN